LKTARALSSGLKIRVSVSSNPERGLELIEANATLEWQDLSSCLKGPAFCCR
jgi:hypothetical protein